MRIPSHYTRLELTGDGVLDVETHVRRWKERLAQEHGLSIGRHGPPPAGGGSWRLFDSKERLFVLELWMPHEVPGVFWRQVLKLTHSEDLELLIYEHATACEMPQGMRHFTPVTGTPRLVEEILRLEGVTAKGVGVTTPVQQIQTKPEVEGLVRRLSSPSPTLGLVLVSCDKITHMPVLDPVFLQQLLFCQLQVALLHPGATWEFLHQMEDAGVGHLGSCYDGAVRLYPMGPLPQTSLPLWMPYKIRDLGGGQREQTARFAAELVKRTLRTRLAHGFFETLERLEEEASRTQNMESLRALTKATTGHPAPDKQEQRQPPDVAAPNLQGAHTLLEQLYAKVQALQEALQASRQELAVAQELFDMATQEKEEIAQRELTLLHQIARLESTRHLSYASGNAATAAPEVPEDVLGAVRVENLEHALTLVCSLWPERVLVLPSAWASAREAAAFAQPQKAWELLWRLATCYWERVQVGGDAQAKQCFTESQYAATESATVRGRAKAVKQRTFLVEGEEHVMFKHLGIGTGSSVHTGWRCHFEYDATRGKVVVGHCGKHLDFS